MSAVTTERRCAYCLARPGQPPCVNCLRVAIAEAHPFVAPEDRVGRVSRPIMCRSCAAWTTLDEATDVWRHPDGSPACVDPRAISGERPAPVETSGGA